MAEKKRATVSGSSPLCIPVDDEGEIQPLVEVQPTRDRTRMKTRDVGIAALALALAPSGSGTR
jgi:hypothetical protein